MSLSSPIANQSTPLITRLYAANDTSENQWSPDISAPDSQNGPVVQWNELSSYKLTPVTSCNGTNPVYSNMKISNLNPINNVSCINQINYSPPNYFDVTYKGTDPVSSTVGVPNNLRYPGPLNTSVSFVNARPAVNGANSAWPNPNANGDRYLARPAWNVTPKTSNGVKKTKRIRTAFTSQQMMELEQEYARTRYLDRSRRLELSDVLHLNERTIKIWFQNRRMKEKKDRAESLEDSEETSNTESSPDLGIGSVHIYDQYPSPLNSDMATSIDRYPVMITPYLVPPVMSQVSSYSAKYLMDNIPRASPHFDVQFNEMHRPMPLYAPTSCAEQIMHPSKEEIPEESSQSKIDNHFFVPYVSDVNASKTCSEQIARASKEAVSEDGKSMETANQFFTSFVSDVNAPEQYDFPEMTMNKNEIELKQELPENSSPQSENCTNDSTRSDSRSWDLSWIRSIQLEEEF